MRRNRSVAARSLALGPILGIALLGGCSGESRETGTQVLETEEMKAQTEEMEQTYAEMGERTE